MSVRRGHTPGERRAYVFETETGERDNPFSKLSEGTEDASLSCRHCGTGLSTEVYHYCTVCSLAAD